MTSESKFPSPQKRSKGSRQGFLEEPSKWKLYKVRAFSMGTKWK